MAYRTRSARLTAKRSKQKFFITFLISGLLIYATIFWILPFFVGGVGLIKNITGQTTQKAEAVADNANAAPPVLNIPFEATNSSSIDIPGYATPGSKVKLFLDDEEKEIVEVSDEGNFTFKNISLNLGTNNIYAKTVDDKSKESLPSKTIRVIFDNEKPKLEISEPEDGKSIQGERKLKVAGKTEPQAKIYLNNSQVIVDSEGKFTTTISLNDGENIVTIKSQDSASNSTELSRRVNFQP